MPEQPWTVLRLITWTQGYFEKHGIESPRLHAEVLLAHVLGWKRIDLYTQFDQVVEPTNLAAYRELIKRRLQHEPLQYLVGKTEFLALSLQVQPGVLIPRPETEVLVEQTIDLARQMLFISELLAADVGTGSGAIAIALAKFIPSLKVVATDVSPEALTIARGNAERHGVANRIRFLEGDFLEPLRRDGLAGKLHFLISNPPYIREGDWANLMPEVRNHEPRAAAIAGPEGTEFHRGLIDGAKEFLLPGGWLILEIDPPQAEVVRRLAQSADHLRDVATVKDHQDRDRALLAKRA